MKRLVPLVVATAALASPIYGKAPATAPAAVPSLKLTEDGSSAQLKVPLISLGDKKGRTVDLVGAVHIADPEFFEGLNERFKDYDVVLFEMVGGDGDIAARLKQEPDKENPIRFFQVLLKNSLGLSYQLEVIDYSASNFVHADMTEKQFRDSMAEKGQSMESLFERAFAAALESEDKDAGLGAVSMTSFMGILTGGESADALKLDLARQLQNVDSLLEGIEGDDGTVILSGRNEAAIAKLREVLKDGEEKIAIFYGAAHLADMERMITSSLGFARKSVDWIDAWEIEKPSDSTQESSE